MDAGPSQDRQGVSSLSQLILQFISCLSLQPSHCINPFWAALFFCTHILYTKTLGQHCFSYCAPRQWILSLLTSITFHPLMPSKLSFYLPPHLNSLLHSICVCVCVIVLVCECMCVCVRNTIFWQHKYYFWGFYVHIFAGLVSVVCSSLLVKYSATEITILTTVFLCSICMQLSHNVWTQREMNRLIKYNFLFTLSNTTVTSKSEQCHWNWCENVNLSGGNSFHLKIHQQSQKRISRRKGWLNICQTHKEPTESDFLSTQS